MTALALSPAFDLFAPPPSPKPLRQHQVKADVMTRLSLGKGNRRIVVQMPTGAGKTRFAAEIINGALAKGNRVAFTVPAISLIDQTVNAFEDEGIRCVGVMQANHPRTDWRQPVQVISVQSLARREKPNAPVVIVDECHLQFQAVRDWIRRDQKRIFIGLSATPWARGMADDWQDLVVPVSMQELIDAGYLSPFRAYAPSHPDLSGVRTVAGDYHEGQAGEVMGGLVADVVDTWLARGEGRPTLVFAVNRAHAAQLVEQFARKGIAMGYCDAHVDLIERKLLFARLARGDLSGIVNVGTLTTGVDADIRCIVMARPTKSEMLFVQCVGRGLRTAPGKADCIILDHADNHARLGFVTDIHHDRLLPSPAEKTKTASEKGEPLPKECGSCGALKPAKMRECPSCGFTPQPQSGVEVEDGELIAIAPGKSKVSKATAVQKQAWWSQLLHVQKARGRQPGWTANAFRERFGVWPRGLNDTPIEPGPEVIGWVRAKDIRFAKGKGAQR